MIFKIPSNSNNSMILWNSKTHGKWRMSVYVFNCRGKVWAYGFTAHDFTKSSYHLSILVLASALWKGASVPVFLSAASCWALSKKRGPRQGDFLGPRLSLCIYRFLFICSYRFPKKLILANLTIYIALPYFSTRKGFLPPDLNGAFHRFPFALR